MARFPIILAILFSLRTFAEGQWTLQQSPTTADLRGIDNVGKGVAWASGTNGTILRTIDSGLHWQLCTIPPNAATLDFRGVQAFDATTAIAMSSGKGDASRLYQTSDGCHTWELIATNSDTDGFWDAVILKTRTNRTKPTLYILGDPIRGHFVLLSMEMPWKQGRELHPLKTDGTGAPKAQDGESAFAASNSALSIGYAAGVTFATGGSGGSHWYKTDARGGLDGFYWYSSTIPVGDGSASSGTFSVAFRSRFELDHWWTPLKLGGNLDHSVGVAVGGDYQKPDDGSASAAYTSSGGYRWSAPEKTAMPHGYRSAVAYDSTHSAWITVGPNGTDVSKDGRIWHPLHPTGNDAPDADQLWNALSLPYAVGHNGRIGKLNPSVFVP